MGRFISSNIGAEDNS